MAVRRAGRAQTEVDPNVVRCSKANSRMNVAFLVQRRILAPRQVNRSVPLSTSPNLPQSETIAQWVDRELACWRNAYRGNRDFSADQRFLNETRRSVFLFDIDGREVTLQPKPAFYSASDVADATAGPARRARLYLGFFKSCVSASDLPQKAFTVALDVADIPSVSLTMPLLSFQKPRGAPNILVPDVDFLLTDHYEHEAPDQLALTDKRYGAVFAGASTGGRVSAEALRDLTLPRLRFAHEFLGHPDVHFRIAKAVQCASPEVQADLEAQPFFGPYLSFQDQLAYRFILSLDGNGATCSRVVRTLRSRSVLLKQHSDHVLYYFHGLVPYRHYLPFQQKADIETYVALDREGHLATEAISAEAQEFSRRFLTRRAVLAYGRRLLEAYAAWQSGGETEGRRRWWRLPRRLGRDHHLVASDGPK